MIDPDRQTLKPVEEKALRLITEKRVHVQWTNSDGIAGAGIVDGDTDTWLCSFSPAGRICTCPAGANHQRCSHALALELTVMAADYLQLELI
jgi:hypothetical protein